MEKIGNPPVLSIETFISGVDRTSEIDTHSIDDILVSSSGFSFFLFSYAALFLFQSHNKYRLAPSGSK